MAIELSDTEKFFFEDAKTFALENIAPYSDQWEKGNITSKEAMKLFFDLRHKMFHTSFLTSAH